MHVRISAFASAVVVVLSLGAVGCDDNNLNDAPPRLVTAPSLFQSRFVSVQPAAVRPEFVSGLSCRGLRPFRTRFNLFVHADRDFFLRGVNFEFRDRAGGRALPLPIPTTVTGPTIHGLGIVLNFDCGVAAEGTLSISVETADRDGGRNVSHVSVPVR